MGCTVCPGTTNEEAQKFEHNSMVVLEQLRNSDSAKSAEEWRTQLFNVISAEDIKARDDQKAEMFKGGNSHLRKVHRLDLSN